MKINIQEMNFKVSLVSDLKRPDLLANVSINFIEGHGRHFTFNGFAVRKSKYDGKPYLTPPSKSYGKGLYYKYSLIEESLWKEIEREVVEQYEKDTIPIIEEKAT